MYYFKDSKFVLDNELKMNKYYLYNILFNT